jgi:hypothetical protein
MQRHGQELTIQMVCDVTLFDFHNMKLLTLKIGRCLFQCTHFDLSVNKVATKKKIWGDIYLQEYYTPWAESFLRS